MAKSKQVEITEPQSSESSYTEMEISSVEEKVVEGPRFVAKTEPSYAGDTVEERLISFLKQTSGWVKVNDFLKLEYKHNGDQQVVNKQLKGKLANMIAEKKILVKGSEWEQLGKFFYASGDPQTQYKTILNTIIEAKLA